MFHNSTKIRRIDSREDLDPDFGCTSPEYADAYVVSVVPKPDSLITKRYKFIALLPELETEEDVYALLSDVMDEFLGKGDKYTVREFTDERAEEYIADGSYGPIISFDPESIEAEKISFLWLVPPKHLMQ